METLGSTLLPLFNFGVSLLKPKSRKKDTLIINGLLRNLGVCSFLVFAVGCCWVFGLQGL